MHVRHNYKLNLDIMSCTLWHSVLKKVSFNIAYIFGLAFIFGGTAMTSTTFYIPSINMMGSGCLADAIASLKGRDFSRAYCNR